MKQLNFLLISALLAPSFMARAQPDIKVTSATIEFTSGVSSFDMGDAYIEYPITYFFVVENVGDANLTLAASSPVTITGTDAADFLTTVDIDGLVLAAGELEAFDINFDPSGAGAKTATITITSDDPDEGAFTFTINANALAQPADCILPGGDFEDSFTGSFPQTDFVNTTGVAEYNASPGWSPLLGVLLALFGSEINVDITADARTGTGALELIGDVNGIGDALTIFPCGESSATLSGYYKFSGAATDSALVVVSTGGGNEANRTDDNSDTLYIDTDAATYTEFQIDFPYDANSVDSLLVYLFTTNNNTATFIVDDLEVEVGAMPTITYTMVPELSRGEYSGKSYSIQSEDASPQEIEFDDTGTKLFVLGYQGREINEYSLTTPYDLTTMSFETNHPITEEGINPVIMEFVDDGKKLFIKHENNIVSSYSMTTGYDMSTRSFDGKKFETGVSTSTHSIEFSETGTQFLSFTATSILEYTVNPAFSFTDATLTNNWTGFSIYGVAFDLTFNQEGSKVYLSAFTEIYGYDLSAPYSFAAPVQSDSLDVTSEMIGAKSMVFDNLGSRLFAMGEDATEVFTDHKIFEYEFGAFYEPDDDDGRVAGTMIIRIEGDTFVNAGGTLTSPTHFTIANQPAGLSAEIEVNVDGSYGTLSFIGTATSHGDADDFDDLQFTFTDAAFTTSNAADVGNATGPASSSLGIDFLEILPPDQPAPVTFGTATSSSIEVNWIEPDNNNSSITGYFLEQKTGSGTYETVYEGTDLSFTSVGLIGGTSYTFRVSATNGAGTSDASDEATDTTLSDKPSKPTLSFEEITSTSVRVVFVGPENNCNGCSMTYVLDTAISPTSDVIVSPYLAAGDIETGDTISIGVGGLSASTTYRFAVVISNDFGSADSDFASVTTDANVAPVINDQSFSLDENTNIDEFVGGIEASDPDGDALTYSITGGNTDDAFKIINTNDLTVNNRSALDFETHPVFELTIQVEDIHQAQATATITINLNDLEETPNTLPTLEDQMFSVEEGASNGTEVGIVVAFDVDQDALTYSITGGNTGEAFTISANLGVLHVNDPSVIVFDTNSSFELTVRVEDARGGSAMAVITILVNKAGNSAPEVTDTTFSIEELSANGTTVGTVDATDVDGDVLTFQITDGNTDNAFAINPSSGLITVNDSAALDFDVNPSFDLTIAVSDGNGGVTISFTGITLTEIPPNNPPEIAAQVFTIDENSPAGTEVGTVIAEDADGDDLTFTLTTAGDPDDAFEINATTGVLTVAQSEFLDFETNPSLVITVEVSDGEATAAAEVTINLNDIDENALGVHEEDLLHIYPNPVLQSLRLDFQRSQQDLEVLIIDLNGRILLREYRERFTGPMVIQADRLSKGMLIVKVNSKGIRVIKRIIRH